MNEYVTIQETFNPLALEKIGDWIIHRVSPIARGANRHRSLACRQKRPVPVIKYFSGNGIAVAAMCADSHKHRPVAANEGGLPQPSIYPPK